MKLKVGQKVIVMKAPSPWATALFELPTLKVGEIVTIEKVSDIYINVRNKEGCIIIPKMDVIHANKFFRKLLGIEE